MRHLALSVFVLACSAGCQSIDEIGSESWESYPRGTQAFSAACQVVGHRDTYPTTPRVFLFDFGRLSGPWNFSGFPLSGLDVRTVPWLSTPVMHYRYEFVDRWQRRCYPDSQWVGSPRALLEKFLTRRIIFRQSDPMGRGCHLRFSLHELEQNYRQLNDSYVTLEVLAALMPHPDGRILAKRAFYIQKAAPTQDARGSVAATRDAVQEMSVLIDEWLTELSRTEPTVTERCRAE